MFRSVVPALFLLAIFGVYSSNAHAAACCGSGHGLGQRLNRGEKAAITLSIRLADRFGSYDPNAQFFSASTGTIDSEGRGDLSGIFAIIPRLQVGLSIPFVLNARRFGTDSALGGGIGDIGASARFDIVPLSTSSVFPAIALTTGLTLPTGRSSSEAQRALSVDATGLGVAEVRPGVFLEKSFSGAASAIFAANVGFRSSSTDAQGDHVQLAPRWKIVAAAGPVFENGLSLSLGMIHERENAPAIGGLTTPHANRYRTAFLTFVGYDVSKKFTLLGSLELDLPFSHMSQNELASVAFSIGLRRSFSTEN